MCVIDKVTIIIFFSNELESLDIKQGFKTLKN